MLSRWPNSRHSLSSILSPASYPCPGSEASLGPDKGTSYFFCLPTPWLSAIITPMPRTARASQEPECNLSALYPRMHGTSPESPCPVPAQAARPRFSHRLLVECQGAARPAVAAADLQPCKYEIGVLLI